MKKKILLLMLIFTALTVNAQSVAIPESTINPSPLDIVENNGTGVATFKFAEGSGLAVPAESLAGVPNVTISVDLKYIELTDADISKIKGTLLKYFSVSYNAVSKVLIFSQKTVIPGDSGAEISFPITVTQNSTKTESYNGFKVNISATDGKTNAQGNAAVKTYTKKP